jgi:predicted HTH transcriptional regulator
MNDSGLKQLLVSGRNRLDIDLLPWQDLRNDFGRGAIAKSCMALRNSNGGVLVMGVNDDGSLDNRTGQPDVRSHYHVQVIQQIVNSYSSQHIAVSVCYVKVGSREYVVVYVPAGVPEPVVCKCDLPQQDQGALRAATYLKINTIYIRTLQADGIASATPIGLADWPSLMEKCFSNREADVGATAIGGNSCHGSERFAGGSNQVYRNASIH